MRITDNTIIGVIDDMLYELLHDTALRNDPFIVYLKSESLATQRKVIFNIVKSQMDCVYDNMIDGKPTTLKRLGTFKIKEGRAIALSIRKEEAAKLGYDDFNKIKIKSDKYSITREVEKRMSVLSKEYRSNNSKLSNRQPTIKINSKNNADNLTSDI